MPAPVPSAVLPQPVEPVAAAGPAQPSPSDPGLVDAILGPPHEASEPVVDAAPEDPVEVAEEIPDQHRDDLPEAPGEVPEASEEVPEAPEDVPAPAAPAARPVVWVAELWIDPDWYAAQGSSDPLPSPGLPDIVPLVKEANLVGRVSHSRGIFPDVDCELDTGCSRRHAMLTTDGTRWWIEDLNSANGTFVGAAAGPLPAMPIPQGRVELSPGQRIYVGAWTRIVVRRATDDEKEAFAG